MPNDTKLVTGPRAGNTTETLKPKEVNVLIPDEDGLPEFLPEEPRSVDNFFTHEEDAAMVNKAYVIASGSVLPFAAATNLTFASRFSTTPGWQTPISFSMTPGTLVPAGKEELETRVLWLEEQVEGLLDRIARYNVGASHKI